MSFSIGFNEKIASSIPDTLTSACFGFPVLSLTKILKSTFSRGR